MNDRNYLDPQAMVEHLAQALRLGLPGRRAHRTMAHSLAYGRHHGPVPDDARRAAVLIALHPAPDGWSIPAVLRPPTMRSHGGQVSLPGGLIEPDETPAQTALREFEEELGAGTGDLQVLGQLTRVYVFVSGFEVTPLVAISREPLAFRPNPQEVEAVVELPLAALCNPVSRGRHLIERRGLEFVVPHFAIAGQQVWGATSLILAEFVALITGADILVCQKSAGA
jgi:8-oxo-dGTP pyrophosphatase MutT (NUDIX family)